MLKSKKLSITISVLMGVLFSSSVYAKNSFTGRVTRVIDGDSLQVTSKGKVTEIRLYGIDCPEYDQRYSKSAKKYVKKSVKEKTVTVYPEYLDSYNRLVAVVKIGRESLNQDIVASGYAWVYDRYCKKKTCKTWKKEEKKARKNRIGLWRDNKPVAPWTWKRRKRK